MSDVSAIIRDASDRARRVFDWYDSLLDANEGRSNPPLLTENILNEHYYGAPAPMPDCDAYRTSGTSKGAPRQIYFTATDKEHFFAQRTALVGEFLESTCRTAACDLGYGGITTETAVEAFRRLGLDTAIIDYRAPVKAHVAELNRVRPDVVFTMPVILESLLAAGELKISPKKIITVGDMISRTWRENVTRAFGLDLTDLLDFYGSQETAGMAALCQACGRYHFEDQICAETVDHRELLPNLVVAPEERLLAVTSSTRTAFPVVRYVTYDLIVGFGVRLCGGRERQSFDHVAGRVASDPVYGERLSLHDVAAAVHAHCPGHAYEAAWTRDGFIVRIDCGTLSSSTKDKIRQDILRDYGAIDQMIRSGLLSDIEFLGVPPGSLEKRRKNVTIGRRGGASLEAASGNR